MDDESGESTAEDDVTGTGRDESEVERLGWGWWNKMGSWFHRQVDAYQKSALRLVTRTMLMAEQGWQEMNSKWCEDAEYRWAYADACTVPVKAVRSLHWKAINK